MKGREKPMKKIVIIAALFLMMLPSFGSAANDVHVVQTGDSLWKIAVKYQIGVKEIIEANPQFKNPDLIYPNDKVNIPNINATKGIEVQVQQLVNNERSKAGLKPLQMDWELQRTARVKACDMAENKYFSHQSPTYGSPFDMMKQFGITYKTAGENIAYGQKTPAEVMNAWMNSPGHKANILSKNFTHIGVGYVQDGSYWTQQFIGK